MVQESKESTWIREAAKLLEEAVAELDALSVTTPQAAATSKKVQQAICILDGEREQISAAPKLSEQ